ncbi:transmembrane protein 19 [Thecamonas trahens ATCC 50062]|uniref:Transmembrane protein 19 n=1 Tax=Thecamonas trahens ATCC 50062 TaxID=461836 RepID=A0A0L0DCK9_THETB|nr:transmembrane protein 19 [Thecamonas trahens ATCC 50062]KNC49053.1 transmembrane protein 19 [Thecamonas trahens ATCC 50062]|eukprot:XP_013758086.1 transmembrane protein 19 [Thecamonas trahens ATCC 50062]
MLVATTGEECPANRELASNDIPRGYTKGSLSASGAVAAFVTGWATCAAGGLLPALHLVAFFISSSALTRYGAKRKAVLEAEYATSSSRSAVQVLANSLTASLALIAAALLDRHHHLALLASLAHYAACAADTWSSELGILATARPRLITAPWRLAPPGTNGGVTLVGTVAGLAGGAFIGLAHALMLALLGSEPLGTALTTWVLLGAASGLLGTTIDSLLGATLQYSGWDPERKVVIESPSAELVHITGADILDNHQVNFAASFFTVAIVVGSAWTLA